MVSDKPNKVLGFLRGKAGRRDRDQAKTRSNHDHTSDENREVGSPRHLPERRESGRFPSAARLLRSLGRSKDESSRGGGAQGADGCDGRLSRTNPSYHSEGKGLKKKNNWTSERELNQSLSPTQKERSHSFCEKSNSASKRRYSYHDSKIREETKGRVERQDSSSSTTTSSTQGVGVGGMGASNVTNSPLHSTPITSQPLPTPTPTTNTFQCTPSDASSSPSSSSSTSTTPTLPKSLTSHPPSPTLTSPTENIYENLPPAKSKSDPVKAVEGAGVGEGGHGRVLERGERERRSSRKLTKDSGYETSPYSESDYANIDLYAEVNAANCDAEGDGDDVTLAPESELASSPSPSAHDTPTPPPPAAAVPPIPRTATHPARMSHDSLERRCSWQEQSIQDTPGDASISPAEGSSASPSPRLERASQRAALETNSSFIRSLCGRSSRRSPLPRYSSAESLSSFAESLVSPGSTSGVASSSLVPAKSTPSLHQDASHEHTPIRNPAVTVALHVSRSTPNLEDPDDEGSGSGSSSSMVTKSSMYSYLHGASTSTSSKGGSGAVSGRYWDPSMGSDDTPDREDYAHHLRSSSYQMLHSRQLSALSTGSAGSYHSRQHSNASNYSEPDDLSPRGDLHHHSAAHGHHHHHHGMDRARFFSYDNLGPDGTVSATNPKYHVAWNVSEPDLSLAPPPYSPPGPGFQQVVGPPVSPKVTPPASTTSTSSPTSTSNTTRHPASPPPPPVRDASSLKYIKYGPGHEKYPSWPVPAANQALTIAPAAHDANISGLPDSPPQSSGPQGSHRSKSWTEQSEYPKEKAGGYARPYSSNKKSANNPPSFQRQLKTVIEKSEKIPKEMFHNSGLRDDVFNSSSNYSFMDAYYKPSSAPYYPLYDREGRPLDDKDYSIPSPPERDLSMGEASLGQVTAAQLEEYVRCYEEFGYTDLIGTTPLLDQLRQESVMWDGGSERDSGRGESESVTESARYSNGRESVTTVVTNSSSASSSETLKWHGSLSDISIMSGHSRDPRTDHNIAHSARVQAPQRHNSESVLYYGPDGRSKGSGSSRHTHDTREHHRRPHAPEPGYPRHPREGGKWSREVVERNNEMNNLKKFPSYSYTQPLSQITESPTAEMRETPRSPQSPTIDFSKPPTVAERIHELERQSRTAGKESVSRWPRDQSGSREREHQEHRKTREESVLQDPRETMDKTETWSGREVNEARTQQRRGSRDSQRGDRDLRLDFSNTSSRKGDTSAAGMDALCSPTTPTGPVTSSRSPTQRDVENRTFVHENFQNILNSFTEVDRSDRPSGVSFSYLDPEKRRKVPDTTLKSIQKQAVMSFYERHAARNLGLGTEVSSSGSQSSLTSSHSAPESSQGKWASTPHSSQSQNLRTDKSGRAGKGVARLGRVPESEDDQPLRPGRRRSSGRLDSSSEISAEDASRGGSQRSSLASESASSRGEQPPALPQKMSSQNHPEGTVWSPPSIPPAQPSTPEETPTTTTTTATTTTTTTTGEEQPPQDAPEDDSGVTSRPSTGHDTLSTQQLEAPKPPSLPVDPPPRPPERPPKKPTLRSLFHGSNPEASAQSAAANDPSERLPTDADPRRGEDSSNDSINPSPSRPYYYRKPPAPDPPKSPPAAVTPPHQHRVPTPPSPNLSRSPTAIPPPPPPAAATHALQLVPPTSASSRSSTPDLPPPPPPPIPDEVLISDEPLPPPPTNLEVVTAAEAPPLPAESPPREKSLDTPPTVPRENGKNLPAQQTYHKDSYMAHRRDWKTGFEGRYRRTISPSGSSRNLVSSTVPTTNTTPTTSTPPPPLHPTSSTITATTTTTTLSSSFIGSNDTLSEGDHFANENGWGNGGHIRSTSTTVSFTAEELRAFKARRANAQDTSAHTPDRDNSSRKLHSSQSSPSLSSSALQSVAGEGSTSSLASGGTSSSLESGRSVGSVCSGDGVSPASPSKFSQVNSWRTSLESLNRANSTFSSSVSNGNITSSSHSPRTITRATSLADPLHSSEEVGMSGRATQDSYQLPRTASINESLCRITAINNSLSRSTSVADSLTSQSVVSENPTQSGNTSEVQSPSQSIDPSTLPLAPASPTSPVAHDGPITAHPAKVTEEAVSPSLKTSQTSHSNTSKSPTSPKCTSSTTQAPVSKSSSTPLTTNTVSDTMNSSPSMDFNSNCDVVILSYGRTPYPEELECDRLSKDYVPQFAMDHKMRALFAPGPEHKTTAHYMEGVFSLELRKDFICGSHARHPDLAQVGLSRTAGQRSLNNIQNNNETSNGLITNDRTPLPSDSAYFTSESKAKMLTRLRGSTGNLQENMTDQQLIKKKEELVASIGRKLEILRAEHEAIKDEMKINHDLGAEVTSRVEAMARLAESEKYKLHVEEIDKITSLLLGLSGRLARAENALMMVDNADLEEKRLLENKRDKLYEQLEEAKKLKENIDRRAVQVSKVLNKYLTEDQYADYDHFIKMKTKLIMDAREIDDKIKLGEEQQKALRDTIFRKQ